MCLCGHTVESGDVFASVAWISVTAWQSLPVLLAAQAHLRFPLPPASLTAGDPPDPDTRVLSDPAYALPKKRVTPEVAPPPHWSVLGVLPYTA